MAAPDPCQPCFACVPGAQDEGLEAFIVDDEEETAAPEHAESSVRAEDEAAVADEEAAAGAVGGRARFRRGPASKPGVRGDLIKWSAGKDVEARKMGCAMRPYECVARGAGDALWRPLFAAALTLTTLTVWLLPSGRSLIISVHPCVYTLIRIITQGCWMRYQP